MIVGYTGFLFLDDKGNPEVENARKEMEKDKGHSVVLDWVFLLFLCE